MRIDYVGSPHNVRNSSQRGSSTISGMGRLCTRYLHLRKNSFAAAAHALDAPRPPPIIAMFGWRSFGAAWCALGQWVLSNLPGISSAPLLLPPPPIRTVGYRFLRIRNSCWCTCRERRAPTRATQAMIYCTLSPSALRRRLISATWRAPLLTHFPVTSVSCPVFADEPCSVCPMRRHESSAR